MFRPAIAPVFWCVSTSAAAFGIPFGLVLIGLEGGWQAAWRFAPHAVVIGGVVAILWATLWALLLHFLFPTRLSSDGVSGYSFWGLRRFIAWEHISRRPVRVVFSICVGCVSIPPATARCHTWQSFHPIQTGFERSFIAWHPHNAPSSNTSNDT